VRLGRLLGHASSSDGSHGAAPDPQGRGLEHAVRGALAAAGVGGDAVDFVSAHGTGTPLNDRIETAVLRRALGARAGAVPVNSIKGALGHTMGAAATLEAIMCLLASRDGVVPGTAGYEEPDPACERFRRATRECLLGVAAVEAALGESGLSRAAGAGPRTALVYVTAAAYAASNKAFIEGAGTTLHFPYTAPSAVPAEVAIEYGLTGGYVMLVGGAAAAADARWQAGTLLAAGRADTAPVLAVETFDECADLWARGRWAAP